MARDAALHPRATATPPRDTTATTGATTPLARVAPRPPGEATRPAGETLPPVVAPVVAVLANASVLPRLRSANATRAQAIFHRLRHVGTRAATIPVLLVISRLWAAFPWGRAFRVSIQVSGTWFASLATRKRFPLRCSSQTIAATGRLRLRNSCWGKRRCTRSWYSRLLHDKHASEGRRWSLGLLRIRRLSGLLGCLRGSL
mmetsp:Transcript_120827/g.352988  ORF Transcript_120827/g.352988 Transcript_120827/m.352988 type:complete len:201 (+) Transcript_120827:685-1287(+)